MKRRDRIRIRAVSKEFRDVFEKPKSFYPLYKKLFTDDFAVVRMIVNSNQDWRRPRYEKLIYWNQKKKDPVMILYYNAYSYKTFDSGKDCEMSRGWPTFCDLINKSDSLVDLIISLSQNTRRTLTLYTDMLY